MTSITQMIARNRRNQITKSDEFERHDYQYDKQILDRMDEIGQRAADDPDSLSSEEKLAHKINIAGKTEDTLVDAFPRIETSRNHIPDSARATAGDALLNMDAREVPEEIQEFVTFPESDLGDNVDFIEDHDLPPWMLGSATGDGKRVNLNPRYNRYDEYTPIHELLHISDRQLGNILKPLLTAFNANRLDFDDMNNNMISSRDMTRRAIRGSVDGYKQPLDLVTALQADLMALKKKYDTDTIEEAINLEVANKAKACYDEVLERIHNRGWAEENSPRILANKAAKMEEVEKEMALRYTKHMLTDYMTMMEMGNGGKDIVFPTTYLLTGKYVPAEKSTNPGIRSLYSPLVSSIERYNNDPANTNKPKYEIVEVHNAPIGIISPKQKYENGVLQRSNTIQVNIPRQYRMAMDGRGDEIRDMVATGNEPEPGVGYTATTRGHMNTEILVRALRRFFMTNSLESKVPGLRPDGSDFPELHRAIRAAISTALDLSKDQNNLVPAYRQKIQGRKVA